MGRPWQYYVTCWTTTQQQIWAIARTIAPQSCGLNPKDALSSQYLVKSLAAWAGIPAPLIHRVSLGKAFHFPEPISSSAK